MKELDNSDIFPLSTSIIGGLSVVIFYWLHLFLVMDTMPNTGGMSFTVLLAAFFSQYVPLSIVKSKLEEDR